MKNRFLFVCICFLLITSLFSCKYTPDNPNDELAQQNEKIASVSFSLEKFERNAFIPDEVKISEITKFELTYTLLDSDSDDTDDSVAEEGKVADEKANSKKEIWNSVEEFLDASLTLDIGTYDFYLNLFAKDFDDEERCVQSGKIEAKEIIAGSNECVFNTKYVEQGDCRIVYKWQNDANNVNRIGTVKMGLFPLDDLEKAVEGYELKEVEFTSGEDYYSVCFAATNLKNGTYSLKIELYDNDSENQELLNEFSDIIEIYGYKTTGERELKTENFNQNYYITYELNGGTIDADSSSKFTKKHNTKTAVILPNGACIARKGYIFKGWYTSPECTAATRLSIISISSEYIAKDVTVYARWALKTSELYVSSEGNDEKSGRSKEEALKTIDAACKIIKEYGDSSYNWKIFVNGNVTGIPTGTSGTNSMYGAIEIPANITAERAKSILITGSNGLDEDGIPKDVLNRGSNGNYNNSTTSSVLTVASAVPVTLTNIKITGGNTGNGGGIFINEGATVLLGDGVLITKNRSGKGGGICNQGTLFMYGSAVIGDKTATEYASYSSTQDLSENKTANYAGMGGGIYNGDFSSTVASTKIIANLYLGYKLAENGKIVKQELTGGIYFNGAGTGGAIYNARKSNVYFASGILQYNGVSGDGAGIYNCAAAKVEMSGGQIVKNSASYSSSVMNGGGVCNDYSDSVFIMSGGVINENQAWCSGSSSNGKGGGVYNGGTMYMYGTAVIGNADAEEAANAESYGNRAQVGGGIYNDYTTDRIPQLYLGYKPGNDNTPEKAEFKGGIYYNYAEQRTSLDSKWGGGGIYSSAISGRGIVDINSGTIAYNATKNYGGGLCCKDATISGGTIRDNFAEKNGGAIYLQDNTESILTLSGDVVIPAGEDNTNDICTSVYSKTYYSSIAIAGKLSDSFKVMLTPENYQEDIQLVKLAADSKAKLEDELEKFNIRPQTDESGQTFVWYLDAQGKLHKTDAAIDIDVTPVSDKISLSYEKEGYNCIFKATATTGKDTFSWYVNGEKQDETSDKFELKASSGLRTYVVEVRSGIYSATTTVTLEKTKVQYYVSTSIISGPDAPVIVRDGSEERPFTSISAACNVMTDPLIEEYTIYVDGILQNADKILNTIPESVKSITIIGKNELVDGLPVDGIKLREKDSGDSLQILTDVPVVIKNLFISDGYAGIIIGDRTGIVNVKADVTLESGTLVDSNQDGIFVCSGSSLRVKDGVTISNNHGDNSVSGIYLKPDAKLYLEGGTFSGNEFNLGERVTKSDIYYWKNAEIYISAVLPETAPFASIVVTGITGDDIAAYYQILNNDGLSAEDFAAQCAKFELSDAEIDDEGKLIANHG